MIDDSLKDKLANMVAERVRDIGTEQGRIPFDTGDLRKSINVTNEGIGEYSVGSTLPYAAAVHDGRKETTIKPNLGWNPPHGDRKSTDPQKARLRFMIGGKIVFARQVKQPAREGKPFLREAAQEVRNAGFDFLVPTLTEQLSEDILQNLKNIHVEIKL